MGKVLLNNTSIADMYSVEDLENTIFCNGIKEEFFGISTILLGKNKQILCEHVDNNIIKCNVIYDDREYKEIPFKVIVDKGVKPFITFNTASLLDPLYEEQRLKTTNTNLIKENNTLPNIQENFNTLKKQISNKEAIIKDLDNKIKVITLKKDQEKIIKEQAVKDTIKNTIESGVEEYKQKLFEDFFNINNEQAKIKDLHLQETIQQLVETFNEKYLESVAHIRNTSVEEVKKYADNFLENLTTNYKKTYDQDLSELQSLVEETIKSDLFLVTDRLQEIVKQKTKDSKAELYEKLENYKLTLKQEIAELFENNEALTRLKIEKDVDGKILKTKNDLVTSYLDSIDQVNKETKAEIYEQLQQIEQKINTKRVEQIKFDSNELVAEAARLLVEEDSKVGKRLNKFKDQLLKDLQKAAENYTTDANKRMMRYAEMMSGGGSVAMQFANGGTMQGSLNVTGQFLSAGVDLSNIFITSETDSQTLAWSDVENLLSITNGNTISLSSLYTPFASNSGKYESVFTTVQTNSATTWNYQGTDLRALSANWQDTYTNVQLNSANWNTAYNISTDYQNVSGSFATNTALQSVSSLLTPLTLTNTLTGQLVLDTHFDAYKTSVAAATAILLPTTVYQNASGNWQDTYTNVQANSTNWNYGYDVATYVQANSADWEESAEIIPTVTNYLSTNNVLMSGVTVTGDISATGIIYAQQGNSSEWVSKKEALAFAVAL